MKSEDFGKKLINEKKILKELLVDETDIVKDLARLVEKAKNLFQIEKSTGKIIFRDFGKMTDVQRICSLLISQYFASKLELIKDPALGVSEMANELSRPKTAFSGHLKKLKQSGLIEQLSNKKYIVVYHRISEIFDKYLDGKNE